jgi:hypothetical protein
MKYNRVGFSIYLFLFRLKTYFASLHDHGLRSVLFEPESIILRLHHVCSESVLGSEVVGASGGLSAILVVGSEGRILAISLAQEVLFDQVLVASASILEPTHCVQLPDFLLLFHLLVEPILSSLFVLVDASQDMIDFSEGSADKVDEEVVHHVRDVSLEWVAVRTDFNLQNSLDFLGLVIFFVIVAFFSSFRFIFRLSFSVFFVGDALGESSHSELPQDNVDVVVVLHVPLNGMNNVQLNLALLEVSVTVWDGA